MVRQSVVAAYRAAFPPRDRADRAGDRRYSARYATAGIWRTTGAGVGWRAVGVYALAWLAARGRIAAGGDSAGLRLALAAQLLRHRTVAGFVCDERDRSALATPGNRRPIRIIPNGEGVKAFVDAGMRGHAAQIGAIHMQ